MNILHLSDVHFGLPDPHGELRILLDALVDRASTLSYDIVVFTGDLAQSGDGPQYTLATTFLERLRGTQKRPLLIVPGNHDLQRTHADGPRLVEACESPSAFMSNADAVRNPRRFQSFLSFSAEYAMPWQSDIAGCAIRLDNVSFIGINTALVCHRNDEEGSLAIDVRRLNELLADEYAPSRTVVVLGHHPLKHLAPWNQEVTARALYRRLRGAHLYLHGHLHEEHGAASSEANGHTLGVFQAGATYTPTDSPLSFWHYKLDSTQDVVFPQLFRWTPSSGTYERDNSRSIPVTVWLGRPFVTTVALPAIPGDDVSQNPTAAQPVTSEGRPDSFRLRRAEQAARDAAAAALAHPKIRYRFNQHHLLHLDLQEYLAPGQRAHANTVPSPSTLEELVDDLSNARSIILIAPPGAGKTITLLQLAEKLLTKGGSPIPIVLPVASWISSGEGLCQYLTERFTALGVELPDVELLLNSSRLTLLLNGWNEGAEGEQARANDRIREFALSYPNTALAITTRATRTTPALSRARVLTLRQLTLTQKTAIAQDSNLSDPEGFLSELKNNVALSKITNTPLFFAVALQLARSNRPIPHTRAELLGNFTKELIATDNHSDMLEVGPCRGFHNWYLEAAARSMTDQARTVLTLDELNIALANCSRMLQHDGYLSVPASATEIADSLVRHHTLVQLEAAGGYAFVHQQFQEWFAAHWLKRHVSTLSDHATATDILKFQRDVLNQTLWRPALEFAIELLTSTESHSVIADIVRWMIPVDLIVAAEFCYIGGEHVWSNVHTELGALLRDWYKRDSREHQRCALAAMLATGAADFADLIWPELGNDDQSFYKLVHLCGQNSSFRTSSLGVGWQARVANWSESQQEAFFLEVYAGPDEIDFAEARAISGPPSVRIAALALLIQQSEFARIGRVISATEMSRWPPEFYKNVLSRLPSEFIVTLSDKLHDALNNMTDLTFRHGLIDALQHTTSTIWIDIAKQDLDKALIAWRESKAPSTLEERLSPHWATRLIYSYVELLKPVESEWIANWLVESIGRDLLWERPFIQYLQYLPASLLVPLVHAVVPSSFTTSHMEFIRALPSNVPTRSQTAEQLQALLANDSMSVRCAVLDVYLEGSKPQTEQMRLRTALRDLPIGQLVDVIAFKAKMLSEFDRLKELAELVSPGSLTDLHLFEGLSNAQRETLRSFIYRVVSVLPEKEEGLPLRPPLAVILGALGYVDDVVIVAGWVAAEQERWEAHHHALARAKTFQERRLLGEYGLNWWPWYRSALARFKCLAAEQVLLAWLNSGYLIGEGAQGLVELSIVDHSLQALSGDLRGRFCALPPVRPRPSDPRAQARANAIIAALERFDHSALSDFAQREALTMTAAALADFNDARAVDHLLKLDATRAGWSLVKSSIAMCRRGAILPGRRLATALEPFLAKHEDLRNGTNNDSWWIVMDALSVLLASDEPTVAIERMRRIPGLQAQSGRVHDLCNLLSTCLLPEAGAYLAELIGSVDYTDPSALRAIEALARSNHAACHACILGLVMQHTSTCPAELATGLRRASVNLGRTYPAFRTALISSFQSAPSDLATYLATILAEIGTDETAEALLCYPEHGICEPVFWRMLNAMIEIQIPIEGHAGAFRIAPREATVFRRRLAALLVSDAPIRGTACRLLASIRAKRLVAGYPANEPLHPDITVLGILKAPWPLCN